MVVVVAFSILCSLLVTLALPMLAGIAGGLALIFHILFATGDLRLGSPGDAIWKIGVVLAGGAGVAWSLRRPSEPGDGQRS